CGPARYPARGKRAPYRRPDIRRARISRSAREAALERSAARVPHLVTFGMHRKLMLKTAGDNTTWYSSGLPLASVNGRGGVPCRGLKVRMDVLPDDEVLSAPAKKWKGAHRPSHGCTGSSEPPPA